MAGVQQGLFNLNSFPPIDPETIQRRTRINTFHKWINKILPDEDYVPSVIALSDSFKLIRLLDVLTKGSTPGYSFKKSRGGGKASKAVHKYNIGVCLKFLKECLGITCDNISPSDIANEKMSPTLDLVWILIQNLFIDEQFGYAYPLQINPVKKLFMWLESKIDKPELVKNWSEGRALGALINAMSPGLCPNYLTWEPDKAIGNITWAMTVAQTYFGILPLITPAEMAYERADVMSMATYLSQFVNAKYVDPSNTLETEVNGSDQGSLRDGNEKEEDDDDDGDEGKKKKTGRSSKRKKSFLDGDSKKVKLEKFEDVNDGNVNDSSKSESLQVETRPIKKNGKCSVKVEKELQGDLKEPK